MTAMALDERTGRVTLDGAAFDRLIALARGEAASGPDLAELRGVAAHPAVAAGLSAVLQPVCTLRVGLTDAGGIARAGEGWIGAQAAALLLDRPEGSRDLITVQPAFVPAVVARVVRLGPRPLEHPGPACTWRAEMSWTGRDGAAAGRALHVADDGKALRLVAPDGLRVAVTPTAVWRALIRLLPDTAELARDARG